MQLRWPKHGWSNPNVFTVYCSTNVCNGTAWTLLSASILHMQLTVIKVPKIPLCQSWIEDTQLLYIYIYIYTIVRGWIKGATCGHGIYTTQRWPQGVYCWVRGVYLELQHREMEDFFCFAMEWPIPPSPHYRRATANIIEPPYSVLAQQPKHHTNFPGYSYSDTVITWCVEPHTAGQMLLFPCS